MGAQANGVACEGLLRDKPILFEHREAVQMGISVRLQRLAQEGPQVRYYQGQYLFYIRVACAEICGSHRNHLWWRQTAFKGGTSGTRPHRPCQINTAPGSSFGQPFFA